MPQPKVDSSVIQLSIRESTPEIYDEALFFRIVRGIFTLRRKTVLNALSGSMGIEKASAQRILERAGIEPTRRPEELDMPSLAALCRAYGEESAG